MRTAVFALMSITTIAVGDPAAKAPLSAADQKQYNALLAKGRQLETAGKHADAIAAFDAGLKVAPDDATLLGELGAAAYQAKDYVRAEEATRKAIANAAAPNVLGASQYNLGMIQESRKDTAAAIASYSASLRARPNSTVRARLTKLDPKAAAALDPYKPVAMVGPFPTVDGFCKSRPAKADIYGNGEQYDCGCSAGAAPVPLTAPYVAAQLVTRSCPVPHTENAMTEYSVAVQLATGWYVANAVDTEHENRHCTLPVKLAGAKVADVGALVDLSLTGNCVGGDQISDWTTVSTVIVGVGTSKAPSATPEIMKSKHEVDTDIYGHHPKVTEDVALELAWSKDGTLNVTGKTKGIDQTEAGTVLGKHTLVFP